MPKYDVAIVGAGPAGLAAALYTSREDLSTIVVDKGVAGGLIATTEIVENYPGFPEGIGGPELASHMRKQAERFGAEVKTGVDVKGLRRVGDEIELETGGDTITASAVLVATGSSYKKLGVPGEKELEGRGVHYCATCDGPLYRGKRLVAVGGGNAALQEGLFLAKFADKLTLLVRGSDFRGDGVLARALTEKPNVKVELETSVTEVLSKDGRVSGVKVQGPDGPSEIKADGLFPFIGLLPNSQWLGSAVQIDERGFVKADRKAATSMRGVFAAGDIIEGSVGQLASAVGEGVSAALAIREYLDPNQALAQPSIQPA